ncbi:MAG: glycosyltransferase [Verrucomicrobiota bacterium]
MKFYYIIPVNQEVVYKRCLEPSFGIVKPTAYGREVVCVKGDASAVQMSIFKKYNAIINILRSRIAPDDVVVFLHEDITIRDPWLEHKVLAYFKEYPQVAVAGVIGTTVLPEEGGWWLVDRKTQTRGHILQGHPDATPHHMVERVGQFDDLVSVDGCVMFVRGAYVLSYPFDQDSYSGYHFYDLDYCIGALMNGFKVGVVDVLVEHASEGPLNESWKTQRDVFVKKWKAKGLVFPITKEAFVK